MAAPEDERFSLEVLLPSETVAQYGWLNRAGEVSSVSQAVMHSASRLSGVRTAR